MASGLPALPISVNVGLSDALLLIADTIVGFSAFNLDQWGIFKDGEPLILADSVISIEFKQNWRLADYPIEEGGFESYDKVNTPFNARVRFSTGGSPQNRQDFLDSIAAIAGDLNLYDVVTPEVVYTSTNVESYEYRRTSTNGVGLLQVDINLSEIRVTETAQFSNTQSTSGASAQNGGTVQTQDPTSTQLGLAGDTQ